MPSRLRRTLTTLALALLLTTNAAGALPGTGRTAPGGPATLFDLFLQWLASAWEKAGGTMDPDGQPAVPSGDAGGEMDPDGLSVPSGDEGGAMDPNG
jgi:hypothetical protein